MQTLCYRPCLDRNTIAKRLDLILKPGKISDPDLGRRIRRLQERFKVYAGLSPYGLWRNGLAVTDEMRGNAEIYLPMAEISAAFRRLFTVCMRFEPFLPATPFPNSCSWLDLLSAIHPFVNSCNPAVLLSALANDGDFRCRFMFRLFLPRRYGGGFNRYPAQQAFLQKWLSGHPQQEVRALDAASGTGEGVYELAMLLRQTGYAPEELEVHGSTVEPLELFAAAHAFFPHDPARQAAFLHCIEPLAMDGTTGRILFKQEDIAADGAERDQYDIILCNGLLGGPFLNDRGRVAKAVERLCSRLKPGGILLAADRFHGGWKRQVPTALLRDLLLTNGLESCNVDDGVAGVKPRTG